MMQDTCGINKVDEWNQCAPVQTSVNSSQYVEIPCYTSHPRDDQAALEFRLDKTDTAIDPSSMFMHLILQVVDENGKAVEDPTEEEIKNFLKDKKTDLSYSRLEYCQCRLSLLFASIGLTLISVSWLKRGSGKVWK